MDSRQSKIAAGSIILALFAWLISPLAGSVNLAAWKTPSERLLFDGSQAYSVTQEFVTKFPSRVLGSLEARQSTGYLQDHLQRAGYTVDYVHFDARIAGIRQVGRNLLAYKQGKTPEILAFVAHYDTAGTTFQGATDNGSGVGVLLELARVYAERPTRRSLIFILSDGGEWGMLGARDVAEHFPERNRIAAVVSLDHVTINDIASFSLGETGQFGGFSPPWLRQIARKAAESQGVSVVSPWGPFEIFDRALSISWADHGPFLHAGIPAINVGSESTDRAGERAVYHSAQDTIDKLKVSSVEKYGLVAELLLRALDDLTAIPSESSAYFRIWRSSFLSPRIVAVLIGLTFLPIPVILYFFWRNYSPYRSLPAVGREALVYLSTLLPIVTVYFLIGLFRALRLLPVYSLYPATPRDPVLSNPSWNIIWSLLGLFFVVSVISYLAVRFSSWSSPRPNFSVSKFVLLVIMAVIVVFALMYNPYWAVAFLFLPAWVWGLVGIGRGTRGRLTKGIWILAAGIPYYLFLWLYSSNLYVGWNIFWYEILAVETGLFTSTGYFLGAATIALGIRFLVIQFHDEPAVPS